MKDPTDLVRVAAQPLAMPFSGDDPALETLIARCRGAEVVLIGESTHGTHEFQALRAALTARLVASEGFNAIALEADWPSARRLHRHTIGGDGGSNAADALEGFRRFPQWMWRNSDMLDFAGWLRQHNQPLPEHLRVHLHGLDLYSMNESIHEVVSYLERIDPAEARRFAGRYACFDHFGGDTRRYGLFAGTGISRNCEEEVVGALAELRMKKASLLAWDGDAAAEAFFSAERNAAAVADAESYYRTMFRGDIHSWNLRDRHMMDTLLAAMDRRRERHGTARTIVWAHNSHVGDASATTMGRRGEFSLGELARSHFGDRAVLVGLTTSHGTVTAADDWDAPARRMELLPPLAHSCELAFHKTGLPAFLLEPTANEALAQALSAPLLQRAIGVVYRRDSERGSHYLTADLTKQFDVLIHIDTTRALEPLETAAPVNPVEVDETYPTGV
jgi:erythromycin esterase-like protein